MTKAKETDRLIDDLDASVSMLGRLFTARHGEMCCESGLSGPQMLLLRTLAEIGRPLKVSDVASAMGVKAPAASTMVEGLERKGMLERHSDPDDRRVSLLTMTDAGRGALAEAEEERREHLRRYASILSEEDIRTLVRIHKTLIEAMVSERI
jgi:DNA-binding MarR family transcriptional regulator